MRGKSYSNNSKLKAIRGGETKVMSKKFIAIISALALVVTLLAPVGVQDVSARSDNYVDRVVTVSDDTYLGRDIDEPNLIIENDDSTAWPAGQIFRLSVPSDVEWRIGEGYSFGNAVVRSVISDQTIEIRTTETINPDAIIEVPLIVEIDGAEGEIRVTVDARDSRLSSGSYTFAIVSSGKTIATVGTKTKVSRGQDREGANIVIDETVAGALKVGVEHGFRLRLPSNYTWSDRMGLEQLNIPDNWSINANDVRVDGRDLYVTFKVDSASTVRQSITVQPLFNVSRDAKYGDVSVALTRTSGDISSQSGLIIAEYLDYGVVVEVDEVKEILAGKEDGSDEDYQIKVTIEETSEGSLVRGRVVDFELPSWVRIATDSDIEVDVKRGGGAGNDISFDSNALYSNNSKFELDVNNVKSDTFNGRALVELTIPVTIEGTRTGDVELTVSGAGIEEQTIVVAKAIAPVTAEVEIRDVRLGRQGQEAADIIIKENVAGAIKENESLLLSFISDTIGFYFDGADYEVIEGDLEIDQDDSGRANGNRSLQIVIDNESTEPSTIKVSNVRMTVDRTAPEGPVKLDITGKAVVENGYYSNFANRIARFDFANVITPAPGDVIGTSIFTIDSTTYTVIESGKEVERTMDVAPYIRDSRTFLPVFFVAQSLGVPEQNVVWEPHSKTVTIYKGDRIAQMQIGSKVLTVNGTAIQMDTAPEIRDGRTMLPIYYVGQALGASVEWDGDARTVTVTQ